MPSVAFDAARILQVLCNLLSNALKFTPAQGSIVVRLEHVDDNVVCCVSDTGEGIPDDKLEAVFDRFVQLTKNDRRGVGLGLFISKCIVQGHGGRIWVENRTGAGSTFCFSLADRPAVRRRTAGEWDLGGVAVSIGRILAVLSDEWAISAAAYDRFTRCSSKPASRLRRDRPVARSGHRDRRGPWPPRGFGPPHHIHHIKRLSRLEKELSTCAV